MEDYQDESLSSAFRRTLRRWRKQLNGEALEIADISRFSAGPMEARRAAQPDTWNVFRRDFAMAVRPVIISPIPMAPGHHISLRVPLPGKTGVSLEEALDAVRGAAGGFMEYGTDRYDHAENVRLMARREEFRARQR